MTFDPSFNLIGDKLNAAKYYKSPVGYTIINNLNRLIPKTILGGDRQTYGDIIKPLLNVSDNMARIELAEATRHIHTLDHSLIHSNVCTNLTPETPLYRGMDISLDDLITDKKGKTHIYDFSFSSTSKDLNHARKFANKRIATEFDKDRAQIVLKINQCNPIDGIIKVFDFEAIGDQGEKEVLFQRKVKYTILDREPIDRRRNTDILIVPVVVSLMTPKEVNFKEALILKNYIDAKDRMEERAKRSGDYDRVKAERAIYLEKEAMKDPVKKIKDYLKENPEYDVDDAMMLLFDSLDADSEEYAEIVRQYNDSLRK